MKYTVVAQVEFEVDDSDFDPELREWDNIDTAAMFVIPNNISLEAILDYSRIIDRG